MRLVKLWGGMGNQMFQYAFGEYLRKTTKEEVYFINQKGGNDLSFSPLRFFNCPLPTVDHQIELYSFFSQQHRLKRKLLQIFPFFSSRILVENFKKRYSNYHFKHDLYDGYWQDLYFIDNNQHELRAFFQLKDPFFILDHHYFDLIGQQPESVSIHFRRTDFLFSAVHHNLNLDYYQKAIATMRKRLRKPVFFIFSDDISWVKAHLEVREDILFVSSNSPENNGLADFALMSLCKHHIIANSSYSWWAAWLNSYSGKQVVAPTTWYSNQNHLVQRIVPKEWISI